LVRNATSKGGCAASARAVRPRRRPRPPRKPPVRPPRRAKRQKPNRHREFASWQPGHSSVPFASYDGAFHPPPRFGEGSALSHDWTDNRKNLMLFSGRAHPELAEQVAKE